MKITNCRITAMPKSFFDPMPKIIVTLEDGTSTKDYVKQKYGKDGQNLMGVLIK